MIQEITLRPMQGNYKMTTLFTGKYFDAEQGRNVILVELGGGRFNVIYDREPTATEKLFKKWFGENQRDFTLRWNDDDKKTSDFVIALQRHTQVYTEGWSNPNRQGTPQFEFIDKRHQDDLKVKKLKEKAVVFNMVNNMNINEFMNIAFFVGHNPVGKSFEETFVRLLDFSEGILMKNPNGFLSDWGSPDQNHIVTIRKAIDLKIISTKDGKYYVNTEIVGDSADGVIAYMKVNDKLYDYVQRQVSERDILPLDVNRGTIKVSEATPEPKDPELKKDGRMKTLSEKADFKLAKETENTIDHDERAILKAKMKKYGLKGWQTSDSWRIETLKTKVLTYEQEHKELVA